MLYAVSPEDHVDCPGRVIVLAARRDWAGWIHEYCTTPDVHRVVESEERSTAREAEAAARAEAKVIAQGYADSRAAFLTTLFAGKLPRVTQEWLNRFALVAGLTGYSMGTRQDAGLVYAIANPELLEAQGEAAVLRWAVDAAATAKGDALLRLALAGWVVAFEEDLTLLMGGAHWVQGPQHSLYLGFLAAVGFAVDEAELAAAAEGGDLALAAGLEDEPGDAPVPIVTVADIDEYATPDDEPLVDGAAAEGDPLDEIS